MRINNFVTFINERLYGHRTITIGDIDFGITYDELDEVLIDLMDELQHVEYSVYSGHDYVDTFDNTKESFVIVFENSKGINDENRSFSNDYFLHSEESVIHKHLGIISSKLELYNLKIIKNDFANSDIEYCLVVSRINS